MDNMRRNTLKGMGLMAGVGAFGLNLNANELQKGELLFVSDKTKDYASKKFDTVKEINLLSDFTNSRAMIENELMKFDRAIGILDNANFIVLSSLGDGYKISSSNEKDHIIFKIEKDEKWQNI